MSLPAADYSIDGPPPPNLTHLSPVFLALHLAGGHVGIPILIATCLLSKGTLRHPTLVNFFCTWVLHSISFCLTLYQGKAADAPVLLCHAQSAFTHGTATMCATSSLIVILQVWSMFSTPDLGVHRWGCTPWMFGKLAAPYAVFLFFTIITAILQLRFPAFVNASNGLYCTFYKNPFRRIGGAAYSLVAIVLTLGFEILIAIRYFYMWRHISTVFPLANRTISPILVLRLSLFNVYSAVSVGAGIAFVSYNTRPWAFMIQAGVPLVVVLVFGASKDLFMEWQFWKKKRKMEPHSNGENTPQLGLQGSAELLIRTPTSYVIAHNV